MAADPKDQLPEEESKQPGRKRARKPGPPAEEAPESIFEKGGVAGRIMDTVSSILGRPQRPTSNRARKKQAKDEANTSKKTIKKAAKKAADALTIGPEIEVFPLNPDESIAARSVAPIIAATTEAARPPVEVETEEFAVAAAEIIEQTGNFALETEELEFLETASISERKEKVLGAKAAAQSSKFELQIKTPSDMGAGETRAPFGLPPVYEATRVVMLVRDPQTVFAYWELSAADREKISAPEAEPVTPAVLRVFDLGEPGRPYESPYHAFDFPIDLETGSSYLRLFQPNHIWRAELGQLTDGGFQPLCRSNLVRTPRDSVADWDEETIHAGEAKHPEFMEIFYMSGGESVGSSEPVGTESIARRVQEGPLRVRTIAASDLSSPQGGLLPGI